MFDWLFGSSMVYVLICCGENAVPIAKYKNETDCLIAQHEIIDWSIKSQDLAPDMRGKFIFNACIKADRLISR